jgi:LL-diaminopimelate aminotransferase
MEKSERLKELPPYLFAEIDRLKEEAKSKGLDIINLGIGDPDQPTPSYIIAELEKAARDPRNHRYADYEGLPELRKAISSWYRERFGVELNPEDEVLPLIGAKEGIGHLPLACINPGDVVLIPDPGYPVYRAGTIFAGGIPCPMPLRKENGFLPDLEDIDRESLKKAKIIFLNYPNNPTGAIAERDFFERVVKFASTKGIVVCHDATYSEVSYDGYKPLSLLQIEGAKEVGIEFHSLSKTYNMTGWRIGWVSGNARVLKSLREIKTNLDSGIFQAIQYAGIKALSGPHDCVERMRKIYQERRDVLAQGLKDLGWEFEKPKATFYLWVSVPRGHTSTQWAASLLQNSGVVVTPGVGFGKYGEGYIRIALTVDKERLVEALKRIKKSL